MLYNLSNPLDKQNFLTRAEALAARGEVVELKSRKHMSLNQNSYLHVLLDYFVCQYGESLEYVKTQYFKVLVNPDIFIFDKQDRFRGKVKSLRSTADLTTEEMSVAIERFRNWSSKEAEIYLPSANEHILIREMEIAISKHQRLV